MLYSVLLMLRKKFLSGIGLDFSLALPGLDVFG